MKNFILLVFIAVPALLNARSFDDIFPGIAENRKTEIFKEDGVIRSIRRGDNFEFVPSQTSGIDLHSKIAGKRYEYLAESLLVIPYTARILTVLDAYNALSKVRDIQGRVYSSHSRGADVPLFEEATRLDSRRSNPIPDPPPALSVPNHETVLLRLKDANFGNTFYRADIELLSQGILYSLVNTRNITYLLFTVMREGNFSTLLYLEPLEEGMLVYSVAGTNVSNLASGRIDVPSAISKRLAVFIGWITDGISKTM